MLHSMLDVAVHALPQSLGYFRFALAEIDESIFALEEISHVLANLLAVENKRILPFVGK